MIDIDEIKNGQHCWAKSKFNGNLIVVLKTQGLGGRYRQL